MTLTGQSLRVSLGIVAGIALLAPGSALAQAIAPANDGTGTRVTRQGDRHDIRGGQLSRDGANLFHSFERFGLSQGEIANFLSNPQIQSILGRVTGGETSLIDGLIRVSGGSSNLYLMNPAGILFGSNARLDVPAAFTATTATGIGFAEGWFNASGVNDHAALVGLPDSFAFALEQPGTLVNAGNLAVPPGQSLTLMGGTVANTGSLTAPGGTITVAAVPGQNRVRLSQAGSLLSLEIAPLQAQGRSPQQALSLPELLTGGTLSDATGITVNPDGTVRLGRSPVSIPNAPATALLSGEVTVRSANGVGGAVQVVGHRLALVDATLDASGATGGGTLRLGGDRRGVGSLPTASQVYVDEGSILRADGLTTGHGGTIITWADDRTVFAGHLQARGGSQGGRGGFGEVSGRETLAFRGTADLRARAGDRGTLLLDPRRIRIVNGNGGGNDNHLRDGVIFVTDGADTPFTVSETALEALSGNADIILEASDSITIDNLLDDELRLAPGRGRVQFIAGGAFIMGPGDRILTQGRDLTIQADIIQAGTLDTFRGASEGYFTFNNAVLSDDARFPIASGDVTLRARVGIRVTRIYGEDITLVSREGNIVTGSISSEADTAIAPSTILPNGEVRLTTGATADPTTLRNLDNTFHQGPGSHVRLSARQGSIQLNGVIRAGNTNKLSDSTITLEAGQFRATNPLIVWENDATGAQVNPTLGPQVPVNLYVYGRNTDPPGRNGPVGLGQQGSVLVSTGQELADPLGPGRPLVRIRLLEDTRFSIGRDPIIPGWSGTVGAVGIGGRRDPSVNPILRDNFRFSSSASITGGQPTPVVIDNLRFVDSFDPTSTLEEDEVEVSNLARCEPGQVAQNPGDRPDDDAILDVSALVPPGSSPVTRGETRLSSAALCIE